MRTWNRIVGMAVAAGLALVPPAGAVDPQQIQQAIDRGVKALKEQPALRTQDLRFESAGVTSLVGLTLLECGVPADDRRIRKYADGVRQKSPRLTRTYSLALAILFLDRLGEARDEILIQSMAARLLGGQTRTGTWTYTCPGLDDNELRRLSTAQQRRSELRAGEPVPRPNPAEPTPKPALPAEIRAQIQRLDKPEPEAAKRSGARKARVPLLGDNSNTQFAVLGLWIARRHGVPVEKAVARFAHCFRDRQNADGGWGYVPRDGSRPAMTCAGLLALAVAQGAAREVTLRSEAAPQNARPAPDGLKALGPEHDDAIRRGLALLSTAIGQPGAAPDGKAMVSPRRLRGQTYYFFWSLERVGVALDLPTIGGKDWYAWGAEVLVASQGADGAWVAVNGPQVDTCFALLFLRRSNLAADLTARLRGTIKDPGEVALQSGGVGGAGLAKRPPPGFNVLEQPPEATSPDSPPKPAPAEAAPRADTAPPAPADGSTARLHAELVKAPTTRQEKLLEEYKTGKGAEFTEAMARAIPDLPAGTQAKARDALAERLMRMTTATLRERLRDADAEIRYAAARACATKEDYANFPNLIRLLNDPEPRVVRAARAALRHLAGGRDFGPTADAGSQERARASGQWEKWWQENGPARLPRDGAGKGP